MVPGHSESRLHDSTTTFVPNSLTLWLSYPTLASHSCHVTQIFYRLPPTSIQLQYIQTPQFTHIGMSHASLDHDDKVLSCIFGPEDTEEYTKNLIESYEGGEIDVAKFRAHIAQLEGTYHNMKTFIDKYNYLEIKWKAENSQCPNPTTPTAATASADSTAKSPSTVATSDSQHPETPAQNADGNNQSE